MPPTPVDTETVARQEAIKAKALSREAERAAIRAAAIAAGQTPPDLASLASTITNSPSIAVSPPRHSRNRSKTSNVDVTLTLRAQMKLSLKKAAKRVWLGLLCTEEEREETEQEKREKVIANLRDGGVITEEEYQLRLRAKKSNRGDNKFNSVTSRKGSSESQQHVCAPKPHLSSSASTSRMVRKRNGKPRIPRSQSRSFGQTLKRSTTQPPTIPPQEFSKIDLSPRPIMPEDDRYPINSNVPQGLENYDVTYHPTRRPAAWTYGRGFRIYDDGERIGEGSGVERSEEVAGVHGDEKRARLGERDGEENGTGIEEVKGDGSEVQGGGSELKRIGSEMKGAGSEMKGIGADEGLNGKQHELGAINLTTRAKSSSPTKSYHTAYPKEEAWIDPNCPGATVTNEYAPDLYMPTSSAIIDFAYPVGHPLRNGPIPNAVHATDFESASATIRRGTRRASETDANSMNSGFRSMASSTDYIKGEHGVWAGFKQKIKGRKTNK